MTATYRVEWLDREGAARIRDAWRALAARSLEPDIFADPDFCLPAARWLPSRRLRFLVVWRWRPAAEPELAAMAPVALWSLPLGASVWTHAQATTASVLLDREDGAAALAALLAGVRRLPGRPAALRLAGLDVDGPMIDLFRAGGTPHRLLNPRSRAVLRRGSTGSGLSSKARKELRRQGNRLAEIGLVTFHSALEPDIVEAWTDVFLSLEAQGWKGRRGTALAARAETRGFAREVLAGLACRSQCRIDRLDVGGRPAAMGIVLRTGDRAFFWKTAYDEALARFSPGLRLAVHLTAVQHDDASLAMTDSCAIPGHSMIDRVWPDRTQVADVMVATAADDMRFRLACALDAAKGNLRARAKSLVLRLRQRRP